MDADEVCLGVVVLAPASGLAPGHLALARQVAGVGLHRPAVRAVHLGWRKNCYIMLVYNRNSQHGSINMYSRWKMLVRLSCLPRGTWQAYRWLRFSPSQWSGYHRLPGLDLGLQSYLRWTVDTVLLYFLSYSRTTHPRCRGPSTDTPRCWSCRSGGQRWS